MDKSINKKYLQLIILCFFAYMISYIGRLAYSTNIQNFIETYKATKQQAGYASSAFFICYGAGQFINGVLCEKMNSVKVVSFSLLLSSAIALTIFFVKDIIAISVLWGINGFVLSTLWCNLVKITAQIKDKTYLNKSITWLAISLPVGTFIAYGLSSLLTLLGAWKIYFIISSIVLCGGGLIFLFYTSSVQKDIAKLFVPLVQSTVELNKQELVKEDKRSFIKFISFALIPIFFSMVCCSIIKDGVQTWMPTYLTENYEMPTYFSILITLALPLVGVFAAVLSKMVVNKVKDIFLSSLILCAIAVAFVTLFILFGSASAIIPILIFSVLTLLMHMTNTNFTAIFPIYYINNVKSGQTAGIFNCFAYVGSALSSFVLGGIVDRFGWDAFNYVLLSSAAVCIACSVIGYILMLKKPRPCVE